MSTEAASLERLGALTAALWEAPTLQAGLEVILDAAVALMQADFGYVQLLDADGRGSRIVAQRGFPPASLQHGREVSPQDRSACGPALAAKARLVVEDVERDPDGAPHRDVARAVGFRAVQSTPLVGPGGDVLGRISTHWRAPTRPGDGALRCLDLYVYQAVAFIERWRASLARADEERLRHIEALEAQAHQLRHLASELTLAEQSARERLAKSLHDNLQQLLFSARLGIDRVAARMAEGGVPDARLVARVRQDLQEAIEEARALTRELFPTALHDRSLPDALSWLAEWAGERHGLRVRVVADPGATIEQRAVRTLVFECVKELLFNVAKHAGCEEVDLALSAGAGEVLVTVVDRGRGFDPAEMLAAGTTHGTGLGLFSIRERLAIFGGSMTVDARPGGGSSVALRVPQGAAAPRMRAAPRPPAAVVGPMPGVSHTVRPLRIVIADDHALVREGLRQLFDDRPELHVVGEAANGEEAVALAQALRPDVIVMDVAMPEMDGVEATRMVHAWWPEVVVLGLSSGQRPEGRHAIQDAGAVDYFSKDDGAQRLLECLLAMHRQSARP